MGSNNYPAGSSGSSQPRAAQSYNPAALLNPRGFTGTIPKPNKSPSPSSQANRSVCAQQLTFQFASPNDDSSAASSQAQSPAVAASPQYSNGMGTMIERINGIEQRGSVLPQSKRRKLESEESHDHKHRFANGGSGMLGQYVKAKQEEGDQKPNIKQAETVDLTGAGDDDSDLIVVQKPGEQEICYGMIEGARVNCHIIPTPKPGWQSLRGEGWWPIVKVMLRRARGDKNHTIAACDYTRQIIGNVDPTTASGLSPLLDNSLRLRTDCRIPTRNKNPGEVVGQETSQAYSLDLVLYGPRKYARAVGKHLSQKQLWLRMPPRVEPGITYENPQAIVGPKPPQLPALKERSNGSSAPVPQMMRTVEEIRSEVMGVFDSLTKSEDLPEMNPDGRITTELLRHQKQGLHFMVRKEQPRQLGIDGKAADSFWQIRLGNNGQKSYYNVITGQVDFQPPPETYGGILADMMGLGKTLSILSLITCSLTRAEEWAGLPPVQPHSAPKKKQSQSSSQFNVPTPEPLGLTPLVRNAKTTLLVCPLSTVTNWEEQIKAHVRPDSISYYIYHGGNRIKEVEKLAQYDIVITTYGSVASEVANRSKGKKGPFPLEEIGWFRIVLDEAHMIREQSTLQFKAICRLQAERRWAVTGTPVQNKLDDLAALLAFLRLKPFDERGKFTQFIVSPFKVCDPEIVPKLRVLVDSVTLRRLKDKINLPPRTDQIIRLEFSPEERRLYDVFARNAQDRVQVLAGQGREKMIGGKTYIHILQSILRLRLICAHGRDLLGEDDLELLRGMTEDSAIDLDSDDDEDKPAISEKQAYDAFELMKDTNQDGCISCHRKLGSSETDIESEKEEDVLGYMTTCFHALCPSCVKGYKREVAGQSAGVCPVCHQHVRFTYVELRKSRSDVEHEQHGHGNVAARSGGKSLEGYKGPHTKTLNLVEDLLKSQAESINNPDEPPFKSVVFSGWTSHLDLIQIALDNAGIGYTRLDGKMTRTARTQAMDTFREDDSVHVILVSINAGGLGLNLTSANSVYVMEPQYNPQAEAQAVDRVHRLGQKRPVRTVRYIMNDSFEEKMLELQEKKVKLASLSMDREKAIDKAEAAKQKLMDLRSLFK